MSREHFQERMTEEERDLCIVRFEHELNANEQAQKADIMAREIYTDLRWGFFDNGWWAKVKRVVYFIFVHPFLKVR